MLQKSLTLVAVLCAMFSDVAFAQRYKDPLLRTCAEQVQDETSRQILQRLGSDFIISQWASTLQRKCEATIDKKNPKYLLDIANAEQTVRDLYHLSQQCASHKSWKSIQAELKAMIDIYEEVEIEEDTVESQEGGFSGLFNEEETQAVSLSVRKVRKLKNRYANLSKKAKA